MKLIFLYGMPATGKLTVAQERTQLKPHVKLLT
ncbi:AAA family ATPase [Granulicella sp. S190]|nr:AAA family ATPase [Granulicella sp. S190]